MTRMQISPALSVAKHLLGDNPDGLKEIVRAVLQEVLEAEMTDALGAAKSERSGDRRGYRSGSYPRTIFTRVGKIELRVPQDRDGRFSTELFQRYQRSEQALVSSLAEMYVQGVSTRKVKAITEELCGHAFSASAISDINKSLCDAQIPINPARHPAVSYTRRSRTPAAEPSHTIGEAAGVQERLRYARSPRPRATTGI
jgi:transposase-like protein